MTADSGTPNELSLLAECDQLLFWYGAALMGLYGNTVDTRAGEVAERLWKMVPFIKALVRVGRAHQDELRAAWEEALHEPMPFGMPAIGLLGPDDEMKGPREQ